MVVGIYNNEHARSEVRSYYSTDISSTELQKAHEYNDSLYKDHSNIDTYDATLNFGEGALGVLRIPKMDIEYVIYHGVRDEVLNDYVGHIPSSLLPIGDKGVSVLTAHNGIPGKPLFTDLDLLENGDTFTVTIDKTPTTYQVFKRQILPVEDVQIYLERSEASPVIDLMTCYPFGANTHRLIVSGKLIDLQETQFPVRQANVPRKATLPYYLFIGLGLFCLMLCLIILIRRMRHV